MCGVAGHVRLGRGGERDSLASMAGMLRHRGPDGQGFFTGDEVGLAHTRLSIIDLEGGAQPMCNRDRTLWITFNGEIFNYVELREELAQRGHVFATRSDTEVILHLFEEHGERCVEHLNGQWAFAIWDVKENSLFLSRDRFGILPLFYTETGAQFRFASEIKALFADGGVKRELNPEALNQIFTFWTPLSPMTAFQGIFELPPAHSLTLKNGKIRCERYWNLPFTHAGEARAIDEDTQKEQLLALLSDATRIRLRADVPVGSYLSGGLDSSLIAALIRRESSVSLRTFSIGFEDAEFDESSYAADVSRFLRTEHEHVRCSRAQIADAFSDVVWHGEKPVLRTAPVPMFLLSRLVRQSGFRVVLSGEGADELFGGYDIFKETKIRRFWATQPQSRWRPLLLRRLYPYLPNVQAQPDAYLQAFFRLRESENFFSHLPRWEMTARLRTFFSTETHARIADADPLAAMARSLPSAYSGWDWFCQAQYLETAHLLPGYILSSQGDRMSMAHSVEGRFPFLDHRVAAFACKLPIASKMKVLREKYLLKEAAHGLIPDSVSHRFKQPYRAPGAASFFEPAALERTEELLSPRRVASDGIFDSRAVEQLANKFRAGRAIGTRDDMAMSGILSTQILIDRFINNFPLTHANSE